MATPPTHQPTATFLLPATSAYQVNPEVFCGAYQNDTFIVNTQSQHLHYLYEYVTSGLVRSQRWLSIFVMTVSTAMMTESFADHHG